MKSTQKSETPSALEPTISAREAQDMAAAEAAYDAVADHDAACDSVFDGLSNEPLTAAAFKYLACIESGKFAEDDLEIARKAHELAKSRMAEAQQACLDARLELIAAAKSTDRLHIGMNPKQ